MRLFDLPQAKHFCGSPITVGPGSRQSLSRLHASVPGAVRKLDEGTVPFEVHRANLLDSVSRWLVYALANYRRSLDMLVPVSTPWAQVTLYYSSFFAANAVLGMFGGWLGRLKTNVLIDVERGVAGSQELTIHRNYKSPSGIAGSHKIFWEAFYDSTATISTWAPTRLSTAFSPVNGSIAWQIDERNNVNYDMHLAWAASADFHDKFNPAKFKSLSGPLRQQLETAEQLIRVATYFAKAVGLPATGIEGCGATGTRQLCQRRLVTKMPPKLRDQSNLEGLLEA